MLQLGIEINPQPAYMSPNADLASCIVFAADRSGVPVSHLYKAILHAEWCRELDISSEATLREIEHEQGLDSEALLTKARHLDIQRLYLRYTS